MKICIGGCYYLEASKLGVLVIGVSVGAQRTHGAREGLQHNPGRRGHHRLELRQGIHRRGRIETSALMMLFLVWLSI